MQLLLFVSAIFQDIFLNICKNHFIIIFSFFSCNQGDDTFLVAMEKTAQEEAADTIAENLTREVIDDAVEIFPNLANQTLASQVALEILQAEDSDWMRQKSGDSGIGSTDSPQQGL